jgi:NADPH:quinone reductase
MRAILVERPGGREQLRLVERPVPTPGPDEVLIRVAYAAANWGDIQKRQGIYPDPVAYPVVLGAEVSGTVAAIDPGVRGIRPGARVAAICGPQMLGGYADYVVVPAAYLLPLPPGLSLKAAATLPVAMLTAYHLLHTAHRLRRGEVVLVHAIGGAVGLALTEIGRLGGATMIGTVGSAGKASLPRRYGAARVIDRSKEDFVAAALAFTRGRGVDLVIDSLGADILPRSFAALRPYGRLINIGEAAGEPDFPVRKTLYQRSTSMAGFEVLHAVPGSPVWRRGVRFVMAEAAAGRLRMPVAGVFPLADCANMHATFEGRMASGKLLLEVSRRALPARAPQHARRI